MHIVVNAEQEPAEFTIINDGDSEEAWGRAVRYAGEWALDGVAEGPDHHAASFYAESSLAPKLAMSIHAPIIK
jgi:hypothetical protein